MKKKLKRTIAALSAIAMLFATAAVLPEKLPVGVGITANAENSEIVESNSWLEVSCAENNYKTIDYTSSDENTYTCYVYSSTEYSAVLISVNGWSYNHHNGVLGYDNQVADLASKGARMPKFAELQILLDAGMNLKITDNFNCQEYEVAWVENGKWRGQKGNNKYADSAYHAVFEINRNPIETVSDSIFKTDSSPTLSAVKGEDFTWQGNCDIEISYYNSDKTICDSAPTAAGNYYVKVSTPTIEADEDGNTVRYEASESDYIPFTIVHNFPDTFDSNGFKNCPKCNATVYQPATETTDKYDIDDDGTKEAVYEISNAGQLYWFAGLVNGTLDGVEQNTLANAILTANITVNENLLDSLQYDEEGNVSNGSDFITWTPIADWMGNRTTQYSGTFDGNNKTVSGLYFNGDSTCIGLFGSSESDGNIKNVGVVDSYFKGNDSVGGVCGNNAGTITNCYNAGNLTAIESSATIGGICGYNNGGTIANCYNTGTVTATGSVASVGGVCGCSIELISNCYNIGTVTATGSDADISGICGYNFGPIKNCYYLADTEDENGGKTAAQFKSGEVAYLLNGSKSEGDMVYFYQNLSGENADALPVLDKSHGVVYFYTDCTDKTCYANSETASGEHDFDENGFCTKDSTHYQPATLNETTENYEISNAGQLYWFADKVNNGENSLNAVITADISVNEGDVSGCDGNKAEGWRDWTPIGNDYNRYFGIFDGQGHAISGLYFNDNRTEYVGLFGFSKGTIQNVGVENSYFKGGENVGGVCGYNCQANSGKIINCYNNGTVSGSSRVGGVCGHNYYAKVTNCYNTGTVSGSSNVGSVCGYSNGGTFKNCYYLDTSETDNLDGTIFKTAEQFASGEVTYLLNGSKSEGDMVHFYQNLSGENADALPVLDNTHSVVYFGESCKTGDISYINKDEFHDFDENGFCTKDSTHYQPATLNETTENYEISNAGQLYWFADKVNNGEYSLNAVLTADISVNEGDVSGCDGNKAEGWRDWTPIGNVSNIGNASNIYSGTFDGQDHTVSGLYFNDEDAEYVGLFGRSCGNIKNVGVVDSYFKGNNFVGGVCGCNDRTITNCYNAGNLTAIESSAAIGGICGQNSDTIANCYNTGTVTATGSRASVGGVCGSCIASISNCYNTGTVTASSGADISGICGYNIGPITNCYYLADTEDENGGKTAEQFKSGEVAYLLNFHQTIGEDEIPTLNEQAKAVVRLTLTYDETFGDDADTKEFYYNAADKVMLEKSTDKAYTYRYFDGETELTEDIYLMTGDAVLTVKKEAVKITVPADVDKLELTYKKAMTEVDLNSYVENAADLGDLTFKVDDASQLPEGLELSADGTLSGTPAKAADSVKTTVIVTAKNGETAKIKLTFQIAKADSTVEVTVDGDSHTEGDLVSELKLILSGNNTKGLAKIISEIKALTAGENTLIWEFTPEDENYNVVTGTVVVNAQTTTTTTTTTTTSGTTSATKATTTTTSGTTSATKATTTTTSGTTSATKATTITTSGTTSATKATTTTTSGTTSATKATTTTTSGTTSATKATTTTTSGTTSATKATTTTTSGTTSATKATTTTTSGTTSATKATTTTTSGTTSATKATTTTTSGTTSATKATTTTTSGTTSATKATTITTSGTTSATKATTTTTSGTTSATKATTTTTSGTTSATKATTTTTSGTTSATKATTTTTSGTTSATKATTTTTSGTTSATKATTTTTSGTTSATKATTTTTSGTTSATKATTTTTSGTTSATKATTTTTSGTTSATKATTTTTSGTTSATKATTTTTSGTTSATKATTTTTSGTTSATKATTTTTSGTTSATKATTTTTSGTTSATKATTTTTSGTTSATNATTITTSGTTSATKATTITTSGTTSATKATTTTTSGTTSATKATTITTSGTTSATESGTETSTLTTTSSTTSVTNIADDDLCSWAINDYQKKAGIVPANAEITARSEKACEITLTDENGNVLDVYTVDPKTGTGTDSSNAEVNLPQTGNNSVTNWLLCVGAALFMAFGFGAVKASGVFKRK